MLQPYKKKNTNPIRKMQMNEFGSFFLILFLFVLPFVLADLQVDFYKSGTDPGFRDGGPEDKQKKKNSNMHSYSINKL